MPSLVSIIMPTYNRAHFLPDAIEAIHAQQHSHWELIVVDDGSTDDTPAILKALTRNLPQPVILVTQANAGPAAARNKGLGAATGDVVAFYDSDDLWLPDHLSSGVDVLDNFPDIDWVYFACRREMASNQDVLQPSTFYTKGKPNRLFDCATARDGGLFTLNNEQASLAQIETGIDSGLQNSVIRRSLLTHFPIPDFRVGEDRLLILQALKANLGLAFVDQVTVIYRVHDGNLSDTNPESTDFDKRIKAMLALIQSYASTNEVVSLTRPERAALNRRLGGDYFWKLAYSLCLKAGYRQQALVFMLRGILYRPVKVAFWKTFIATFLHLNVAGVKIENYGIARQLADRVCRRRRLLVIGDSHAAVFNNPILQAGLKPYSTIVCSVGGATISGLSNPNSKTAALPSFLAAWRQINPSKLVIVLGEVDTGFVIWYRATKYNEPVNSMLDRTLENYSGFLDQVSHSQPTIVLSAPLPTIKDDQAWGEVANARREVTASQQERTALTLRFNKAVKARCDQIGVAFISLDESLLGDDGLVRPSFLHKDQTNHHYDSDRYAELILGKIRDIVA